MPVALYEAADFIPVWLNNASMSFMLQQNPTALSDTHLMHSQELVADLPGPFSGKTKRFLGNDELSALAKTIRNTCTIALDAILLGNLIKKKNKSSVVRRHLDWNCLSRCMRSSQRHLTLWNKTRAKRVKISRVCVDMSLKMSVLLPCDVFLGQIWQLWVRDMSDSDGSSLFIQRKTPLRVQSLKWMRSNPFLTFHLISFSWLQNVAKEFRLKCFAITVTRKTQEEIPLGWAYTWLLELAPPCHSKRIKI